MTDYSLTDWATPKVLDPKKTDFLEKGIVHLELMDPKYAVDAWDDIDQDEIRRLINEDGGSNWKPLAIPSNPRMDAFIEEVDKVCKPSISVNEGVLTIRTCTNAGSFTTSLI